MHSATLPSPPRTPSRWQDALWKRCNAHLTPELPAIASQLACPGGGILRSLLQASLNLIIGFFAGPLLNLTGSAQSLVRPGQGYSNLSWQR